MASIKDVANEAGVSVATVSRVLNDSGYVHEDTRKTVNKAIKQLNYKPNEVARSLFKKKSRLIGLLLPDIRNPFFPELARGVEDEVQKHGFKLMIGNADEDPGKETEYIEAYRQNNVIGMISATSHAERGHYDGSPVPIVFLDRNSSEYPSVYANGTEGGRLAARELVNRGSRRITVLKGPAEMQTAQDRFNGAIDELRKYDAEVNVISTNSFSFPDAQKWAKELFQRYPNTDGVIASNDITAAAILHEAHSLGISMPEDLQVIGFDDIPLSSLLFPPLSTIRQPAYEMGKEAASLLLQYIHNEPVSEKHIQLPVTFIERKTTREG